MRDTDRQSTTSPRNIQALPEGIELGDYRIVRTLGQGGFGITYLALGKTTGRKVVIKENLPSFCACRDQSNMCVAATNPDDPAQEFVKYQADFVREARLLAGLKHPNIVQVQGAFEALGTAYYVMPWVGGRELHRIAPAPEKLDEAWLCPLLHELLDALAYLHERNIYHRDIKPANILVTDEGQPVIIDFGTARSIVSERSATLVGSPGYSPIEQITSHGQRGPWTDIYSLGATCYRLITGEQPPDSVARIAAETDSLQPLSGRPELRKRFSQALLKSLDKALAVRGKDRWQSAREWKAALPVYARSEAAGSCGSVVRTDALDLGKRGAVAGNRRGSSLICSLIAALAGGAAACAVAYPLVVQPLQNELAEANRKLATLQAGGEEGARARLLLEERGILPHQYAEAIVSARDDAELVRLLITAGADVNAADTDKQTLLYLASSRGDGEIAKILLESPDIGVNKAQEDGWAPLHVAAYNGKAEIVKKLLAAPGIEVNAGDDNNATPLFNAVEQGQLLVAKLLLEAPGIDVNKANQYGVSPLIKAIQVGNMNLMKLLLERTDIDVNQGDADGDTPLAIAADSGKAAFVDLLLKKEGIDVNNPDRHGDTPLHQALDNVQIVSRLLEAPGIKVNSANDSGETPLCEAADDGYTGTVRVLLKASGIDVNKADSEGHTPLYNAAARYDGVEMLKLLLAAPGIDVNKSDNNGRTPLYRATCDGRIEHVKLLLAAEGIDVNKVDGEGHTALWVAKRYGKTECAELIEAAGGH